MCFVVCLRSLNTDNYMGTQECCMKIARCKEKKFWTGVRELICSVSAAHIFHMENSEDYPLDTLKLC